MYSMPNASFASKQFVLENDVLACSRKSQTRYTEEKWQGPTPKMKIRYRRITQPSDFHSHIGLHATLCICFLLGIVSITCGNSSEPKQLADYPNQLTRDGELVVLPGHGTVYVATDFHAHWSDFNQWLKRTRLIEKIEAGEDVYGLILGDAVDHKPGDSIIEPFGDVQIVDRIMELQAQLGENGERLIYIKGNHEFAAAETYAMLKKRGMTASNRKRVVNQLYQSPQGSYFQQFNFIEHMSDEHYNYLTHLPTVVVGKNGFVAMHAGISPSTKSLANLVQPSPKVLEELLWNRPSAAKADGYTPKQTETLLRRIGGRILIVGHTPLSYLPKRTVKDGVARLGVHQLLFSTGYGASPGVRSYLSIDLSKSYQSVSDLKYGIEIHPLYPTEKN